MKGSPHFILSPSPPYLPGDGEGPERGEGEGPERGEGEGPEWGEGEGPERGEGEGPERGEGEGPERGEGEGPERGRRGVEKREGEPSLHSSPFHLSLSPPNLPGDGEGPERGEGEERRGKKGERGIAYL